MNYAKAAIQYEGTNYAGFQWQNGQPTVQNELNLALSKIVEGKVTTVGASRTDTGVHAFSQFIKISSVNPIDHTSFVKRFNKELPADIRCLSIEPTHGLFRPAAVASSKEYRYFFTNQTQVSADNRRFIANIANALDINAMMTCLEALKGTHDFCNFYSSGSNVKSTVRTIITCELTDINPQAIFKQSELFHIPSDIQCCYQLRIEANGFLKQMIRHIVSAVWMVGTGKLSSADFGKLLDGEKVDKQLWKVAAPNGLFLYQINY